MLPQVYSNYGIYHDDDETSMADIIRSYLRFFYFRKILIAFDFLEKKTGVTVNKVPIQIEK